MLYRAIVWKHDGEILKDVFRSKQAALDFSKQANEQHDIVSIDAGGIDATGHFVSAYVVSDYEVED